jgi:hypothetical protein
MLYRDDVHHRCDERMYKYCIFHSSSVVHVLLDMRKHSLLPVCCRVHIHPSLGSASASTRRNILTSRSCFLLWYSRRISCCRMLWFFRRSWRRTRRRTALRILLVNDLIIRGVSLMAYRGRAGHKWQERRRQSAKREPPVA